VQRTEPSTARSVTAIVVGYNHAHCLGRCFDSLMGQQGLDGLEVIFIDNASTDSSAAMCSWHPQIELVRNPENVGFARAVNQGLARARGRYVALVNPDTAIGTTALRRLVDLLEQRPDLGLVGPVLLGEDGRRQRSLTHYPTAAGQLRRLLRRAPTERDGWLIGALVLARVDLLRQLGGLDEVFFVYGEDMDLSYRAQQLGRGVSVAQGIEITHTGDPRWTPDRLVRVYGAYLRFAARHTPSQRLALGLSLSALWLARGVLAGVGPGQLRSGLLRIWSAGPDLPPERTR
jgi:N-acetylglucosaminyl-diphospho-decaprenol L-rhamnosyltransferase